MVQNTGDVTLSLDFNSLSEITGAQLSLVDLFVVRDTSASTDPYRSVRKDQFSMGLITGTTLSVSNGSIHVANNGINTLQLAANSVNESILANEAVTESILAMGNSPATNQVIGWDGTELQWITPVEKRVFPIPNSGVSGTFNALTLTTGFSLPL